MAQSRNLSTVHPPPPMDPPGLLHLAQLVAIFEGACLLILGLVVLLLESVRALTGGGVSAALVVIAVGITAAALVLIVAAFQVIRPSQTARWLLIAAQAVLAGHALYWVSTSTVVTGAEVVVCETVLSVTGLYVLLADRPARTFLTLRRPVVAGSRPRGRSSQARTALPHWFRLSRRVARAQALVAISAGWVCAVLMYALQMSSNRDIAVVRFAAASGAASVIAGWVLLAVSAEVVPRTVRHLGTATWMVMVVVEAAIAAVAVDVLLAARGSVGGAWVGVSIAAAVAVLASAAAVIAGLVVDPASRRAWIAPGCPPPIDSWLIAARRVVVAEAGALLALGVTLVAVTVALAVGRGAQQAIGIDVGIVGGTAFFGVAGLVLGALWLIAGVLVGLGNVAARLAVIMVSTLVLTANAAAVVIVRSPSIVAIAVLGVAAAAVSIYALLRPWAPTVVERSVALSR